MSIEAQLQHIYPGAEIGKMTQVSAIPGDKKEYRDVKLAQDIQIFDVQKVSVRTAELMADKEGQPRVIKINGGFADENVLRIKTQEEIKREMEDDMKAQKAAENGQPMKPRSLDGKLLKNNAEGGRAAIAANKLQLERVKNALNMLADAERNINGRIALLEKQVNEWENNELGENIIIIAKKNNNMAGGQQQNNQNNKQN
jgi:hypothetical protein